MSGQIIFRVRSPSKTAIPQDETETQGLRRSSRAEAERKRKPMRNPEFYAPKFDYRSLDSRLSLEIKMLVSADETVAQTFEGLLVFGNIKVLCFYDPCQDFHSVITNNHNGTQTLNLNLEFHIPDLSVYTLPDVQPYFELKLETFIKANLELMTSRKLTLDTSEAYVTSSLRTSPLVAGPATSIAAFLAVVMLGTLLGYDV